MRKPVIGLIPLVDAKLDSLWMLPGYMKGIESAGGLPLMLPLTEKKEALSQLALLCDGFLFTGGQDVSPSLYGESELPVCGERCPARDNMECLLFSLAEKKPILGICRGIQIINVLLGGTLYQDIPSHRPSSVVHSQKPPYDSAIHSVKIIADTPLHELLQTDSIQVNSYHHQAVKTLSPKLRAMARAEDGIVEAAYAPEYPYLWGVQWHPEFMFSESCGKIFQSFVTASAKSAQFME